MKRTVVLKCLIFGHAFFGILALLCLLFFQCLELNLFPQYLYAFEVPSNYNNGLLLGIFMCNLILSCSLSTCNEEGNQYFGSIFGSTLILLASVTNFLTNFNVLLEYNFYNIQPWYSIFFILGVAVYFLSNNPFISWGKIQIIPQGPRINGTVKWFNSNKGYGFISMENGVDIFVHYKSIKNSSRQILYDGQAVEFSIVDHEKGQQAGDVVVI